MTILVYLQLDVTCSGDTIWKLLLLVDYYDSDDDGVCDVDEIAGCQDATACNYNENHR